MKTGNQSRLDLSLLENVLDLRGKKTFRCPACAEEGHDRAGNHGVLFQDGRFSCVRDPGHRVRIWELVGIREDLDHEERLRMKRQSLERRREKRAESTAAEAVRSAMPALVEGWRWDPADVWESSPTRPDEGADDPRSFLAALFGPDDIVWTGKVTSTGGSRHRDRWRTMRAWFDAGLSEIGPFVSPGTWREGVDSRRAENVLEDRYVVLDFDKIPTEGREPADDAEKARLVDEALACARWLREDRRWTLRAILRTGSKSLHCWFEHPGEACLAELRKNLPLLGIDPSLIGHPEHPCRLPGQVHEKTGLLSRTLWLR